MKKPQLEVREVTADLWSDFKGLLESRGAPKNCWCMVWRGTPKERADKATRRAGMQDRIRNGTPVGLLGYLGGEPIGWCSVAPRRTYRDLGGVKAKPEEEGAIWSIVCFYVKRDHRGTGLFDQLLKAAVVHARERGARVVEAYPVDPDSPSYRFMGFLPAFKSAGFREVKKAGKRRHVVRLEFE